MSSFMFHDRPVFPRGFRCASRNVGLKPTAKDLALFASDVDAAAAAVFTRNHFPGAPIILGREIIKHGRGEKIIVFKFKRRKNYARKIGHRQDFTEVRINDITLR